MSSSNMVANINLEKEELKGLPVFDMTNMVNRSIRLKIWMMRKRRNHQGLEERPARPPNNPTAAIREEFKLELSEWLERYYCTGIGRLNVIIQKLTQLGQSPTDASKVAKFKEA